MKTWLVRNFDSIVKGKLDFIDHHVIPILKFELFLIGIGQNWL